MNDCIVILFGATGDLSKRKLLPALARCLHSKQYENVWWIGTAHSATSVERILQESQDINPSIEAAQWKKLHQKGAYVQLNFNRAEDYTRLANAYHQIIKNQSLTGNTLLYLATSSDFYCTITHYAAQSGLLKKLGPYTEPWIRIAYEKPFGHDYKSAHTINTCALNYVDETQIYRVDHYLTKELVSNIALVRFTNAMFEPLWNNQYIESVQIILDEKIGIANRGHLYDQYGALSDVVQSHVLQLLALVAMEAPTTLTGHDIQTARMHALSYVQPVDGILGQVDGYHTIQGVAPESSTETFAALRLHVNNSRWQHVPFFVRTGKSLAKKQTVIYIIFKAVPCLLTQGCPVKTNILTISIAPEQSFRLSLNIKSPGIQSAVQSVTMEFCHSFTFGQHIPSAYQIILEEIFSAEQASSVRFDEIEQAWKIIDIIKKLSLKQEVYTPDSQGPTTLLQLFNTKHNLKWQS